MVKAIQFPSPNFDERPQGQAIDILLIHYTGMQSAEAALQRLADPKVKVSAHYLIDEKGKLYQLVDEETRAWHAGQSYWAGETDINACSIGIELVNPGHEFGYRAFPEAQMQRLIELGLNILARHPIPASRVLGHSDVAPLRKMDPGELFDWQGLAKAGIGLWPTEISAPSLSSDRDFLQNLARFGYDIKGPIGTDKKIAAEATILAFCRHFRPHRLTKERDPELVARLQSLIEQSNF